MNEMKILIIRDKDKIVTKISIDNVIFQEDHNFCLEEYAIGYFVDIFHFLTGDRYKQPTNSKDVLTAMITKRLTK
jgi:hypothetical protein